MSTAEVVVGSNSKAFLEKDGEDGVRNPNLVITVLEGSVVISNLSLRYMVDSQKR